MINFLEMYWPWVLGASIILWAVVELLAWLAEWSLLRRYEAPKKEKP